MITISIYCTQNKLNLQAKRKSPQINIFKREYKTIGRKSQKKETIKCKKINQAMLNQISNPCVANFG